MAFMHASTHPLVQSRLAERREGVVLGAIGFSTDGMRLEQGLGSRWKRARFNGLEGCGETHVIVAPVMPTVLVETSHGCGAIRPL